MAKQQNKTNHRKNSYRLRFTIGDKRAEFFCHTVSEKNSVSLNVHKLIIAQQTGIQNIEATKWAQTRPRGRLRDFLIRWKLLEDTSDLEKTIADICDHFQKRRNVKPGTLLTFKQIAQNLKTFFGENTHLRDIKPADASEFENFLYSSARADGKGGLGKATVKKRLQRAKQFFLQAKRLRWIDEDPFQDIRGGNLANPSKWVYLPREVVLKVMSQTPDLEIRAKIALCRFAGARGESEFRCLEWTPDWIIWSEGAEQGTVRLHRTKTEDKGFVDTIIPMDEALETALRDLYDNAKEGALKVFTARANSGKTIKDQFVRNKVDIKTPYNLRRSYCRDLMEGGVDPKTYEYYCGHSLAVALKHYQQMDELRAQKAAPRILAVLKGAVNNEKTAPQITPQAPPIMPPAAFRKILQAQTTITV